jgi:RNA polymerase sigma factor (sigma-70 family)
MNETDLLQRYAENGSEAAFTELVRRNVDLVFSAALRQVGGDRHLAEDVTQAVFTDLARKAASLSGRAVLSGWLYTSTRFAAAKRLRAEQRRLAREREAFHMQEMSHEQSAAPDWEKLQCVLDDAMHDLPEADRNAVLLRYFEGRSFGDVGSKLGLNEDAARMRVERALDKLRKLLGRRGVLSTSSALAALLSQQALAAAPAGLAATVAGTALSSAAGMTLTTLQFMGMTKLKAVAMAAVLSGVTVPLVMQHRSNQDLQLKNQALTSQYQEIAAQVEPIKEENKRLATLLERTNPSGERSNEVFKLRAEVTRLREAARETARLRGIHSAAPGDDPLQSTLRTLGTRAAKLKERLNRMPDMNIPELQFLTEKNWLDAVAGIENLETDDDYRQALNLLRARAKSTVGMKLQMAMRQYADANAGMLPADVSQLQPYLEEPIGPTILERYKITETGNVGELVQSDFILEEIAPPVDDEYETRFRYGLHGVTSQTYSKNSETIEAAAIAFANANNGLLPRDPAHLAPYLREPIDPARVQKFLGKIPPDITTLADYNARQ